MCCSLFSFTHDRDSITADGPYEDGELWIYDPMGTVEMVVTKPLPNWPQMEVGMKVWARQCALALQARQQELAQAAAEEAATQREAAEARQQAQAETVARQRAADPGRQQRHPL